MKNKKGIIIILISAFLLVAAAAFVLYSLSGGASGPEEAVTAYRKACMLYDASDMVKYSSDYNKYMLNGNKPPESDGQLKEYLENSYASVQSGYSHSSIEIRFSGTRYITEGSEEYNALAAEYSGIAGTDGINGFAVSDINVYADGRKVMSRSDYTVKIGSKWYYFK